ncbi:MAG: hypothetical protein WBV53_14740 [Solirubrobacterales bacterium]
MSVMRPGNKSLETVIKTDELYGHDCFWLGPRGRDYGEMLPNPKPWQHANLYPDPNSTYWFTVMKMPEGSVLTIKGQFTHSRYMQFSLYLDDPDMGGYTATGEAMVDHQIEPDPGSENPFVPGADRSVEKRDYTIKIVNAEIPADDSEREPNTMYAGTGAQWQIVYRVYVPDQGLLGDAGVGIPTYTATLADGTELSVDEVCKQFVQPLPKGVAAGMSVEAWRALCAAPDNDPELKPETTPARNPPLLERYFSNDWNIVAVFKTPEARAKVPSKVETGFGGDPGIVYMMAYVSRLFDPVLVIRGKMPQYPDNYYGDDGKGLEKMTGWESRYWSLGMTEAPPSGMGTDAISDFQVPLDEDRNYTIVVSRPEDRPANATDEKGVAWIDWGTKGEGLDDGQNRTDFGLLVFRYMYNDPDWKHDPGKIVEHGTEAEIMGPYFPQLSYTDKAAFEADGP